MSALYWLVFFLVGFSSEQGAGYGTRQWYGTIWTMLVLGWTSHYGRFVYSLCCFCIATVFEGLSDLSYYRWMDTDSGGFIEGISFYTFTLKNGNLWQWLSSAELHSHCP